MRACEAALTNAAGALLPLVNHGIACMSMGFLIPQTADATVSWRGLMVMKVCRGLADAAERGRPSSSCSLRSHGGTREGRAPISMYS